MKLIRKHLKPIALFLVIIFLVQSCDEDSLRDIDCKCSKYTLKNVEGVGTVLDENLGEVEMKFCHGDEENPNPELYFFQRECLTY